MAILDTDTFARTVATGWGTASDGATWALKAGFGHSSALSVNGRAGVVAYDSGGSELLILGSQTTADGDFVAQVTIAEATDQIAFLLRYSDTSNYTRCAILNGNSLVIVAKVAGSNTNYTIANGLTITPGTAYWLRCRFIGQTFWAKLWLVGQSEPTVWAGSITNTASPTTAGQYGALMLVATSGSTITMSQLTISDATSPEPGVESAIGAESASTTATLAPTEAGGGTESATTSATLAPTETGVGGENATTAASLPPSDMGTGAEGEGIGLALPDAGAGAESAAATATLAPTEAGSVAESATTTATLTPSDVGTAGEGAGIGLTPNDVGIGSETPASTAQIAASDTGAGMETPPTLARSGTAAVVTFPAILPVLLPAAATSASPTVRPPSSPYQRFKKGAPVHITVRDQVSWRVLATKVPGVVVEVTQAVYDLLPLYQVQLGDGTIRLVNPPDIYQ